MSRKRDVLEQLKQPELATAVDRFDLPVKDRRSKGLLIEALAGSRKAGLAEILTDLSRDRLKEICRALGLDDSGRERVVIVARLSGESPAPRPAPETPHSSRQKTPDSRTVSTPGSTGAAPRAANRPRPMALKKSELYNSLWQSCDELRGGMDASQYKDYVLVLLFLKYVSDKYAGRPFAEITVPAGASFTDMVALKGNPDIGDLINKKIIEPLANANKLSDFPDFNDAAKLGDGKEKVDRLTNLIAIFENPALDFSKNRAEGDDILGDAYEYLMRHFATESGKSKGQFYTPAEVSRVIAQILGIRDAKTTHRHDRLRSHLRLRLAAPEGGRRGRHRCHALRAGERRRHQRPRPHEHDPARQSRRAHRAGQHADRSQVQGRRHSQNLRLRRRQSPLFRQALEHRPRSAQRPFRALQILRRAARQAGRLCLSSAHRPLAEKHRQRRLHPAAWRAVSRQRRGRHPPQPRPQGLHQGHHRSARQPVLRHRHPRLHRRHRQGGRPGPQGHLHDRRQRAAS